VKAVLQYRASPLFVERLHALAPPWLRVVVVDETDKETFGREMRDAHALLHVLEPVTRAVLAAAPELRLVQKIGVGVNTIDLAAAAELGVGVANMPGTNTQAVAELALTLMLAALRRVPPIDAATRAGEGWKLDPRVLDACGELGGRTVGLVGYGAVARRLAPVLVALGARVLYHARRPVPDAVGELRSIDALFAESDVVSLHVPLTSETEKLVDSARLATMKKGAVLVNTARGGLVDEPALIEALRRGTLRAAGLDVFAEEPVAPTNPLLSLPNVVVMPHVAWLTPETLERSLGIAYANCERARKGEGLLHEVRPNLRGGVD